MDSDLPDDSCLPGRMLEVICDEHVGPWRLSALQSEARKDEVLVAG
jgi:hypothetical protein